MKQNFDMLQKTDLLIKKHPAVIYVKKDAREKKDPIDLLLGLASLGKKRKPHAEKQEASQTKKKKRKATRSNPFRENRKKIKTRIANGSWKIWFQPNNMGNNILHSATSITTLRELLNASKTNPEIKIALIKAARAKNSRKKTPLEYFHHERAMIDETGSFFILLTAITNLS